MVQAGGPDGTRAKDALGGNRMGYASRRWKRPKRHHLSGQHRNAPVSEVLVDLVEEAFGRKRFGLRSDEKREILGHEARFHRVDADLSLAPRRTTTSGIAVELGAMGKPARPGEDRGNRIGRGRQALLMLAVMARHGTARGASDPTTSCRRASARWSSARASRTLAPPYRTARRRRNSARPDIAARIHSAAATMSSISRCS